MLCCIRRRYSPILTRISGQLHLIYDRLLPRLLRSTAGCLSTQLSKLTGSPFAYSCKKVQMVWRASVKFCWNHDIIPDLFHKHVLAWVHRCWCFVDFFQLPDSNYMAKIQRDLPQAYWCHITNVHQSAQLSHASSGANLEFPKILFIGC